MGHARCPFEKVILGAYAGCGKAQRFFVAERMGVECISDIALNNCPTLRKLMRERSRFALKVTDTSEQMPFGKEMKVIIGGLIGLEKVLHPEDKKTRGEPEVKDIHGLIREAQETYTSLPYQEIMKSVTSFQLRKRGQVG
ncbi:MAG: hypothetical protein HY083_05595 [Gammaproteobacteria bacterium]|nr:hypothetical protein [Gammaproteobacteria bacterium]